MSMISFDISIITGLMFGIEHVDIDEGEWAIVVDFAIFRFMILKEKVE